MLTPLRCAVDPVSRPAPPRVIRNFKEAFHWPLHIRAAALCGLSYGPCTFSVPASPEVDLGSLSRGVVGFRQAGLDLSLTAVPETAEDIPDLPLAVWDVARARLVCYSHPLGRGTFYYTWFRQRLFLSTSIQDLVTLLKDVELDPQMVAEYFFLLYRLGVLSGRTFLQGVSQVPPGHSLEWSSRGMRIKRYRTFLDDPYIETKEIQEAAAAVRAALQKAIAKQQPTRLAGCLVSGGLDSSVVAAAVHRHQRANGADTVLVTLSHGVDCPEERQLQTRIAAHLGVDLVEPIRITPRLQLPPLRALNRTAGAPAGGLFTGVYAEAIADVASRGITTLYGGEGGDEVFAPHPHLLADLLVRRQWASATQALGFLTSTDGSSHSLRTLVEAGLLPMASSSSSWIGQPVARLLRLSTRRRPFERSRQRFLRQLLGPFYAELICAAQVADNDLRDRRSSGFSLSTYGCYQQVLELPFYEPSWPYQEEGLASGVRIVSPLAETDVLRAAMALRLDKRIELTVGFRPKRLLAFAVGADIHPGLALQHKVGVSNLLLQMTDGQERDLVELLTAGTLGGIGLSPHPDAADPARVPAGLSLYWSLLLVLVIWFEEVRNSAAETRWADFG